MLEFVLIVPLLLLVPAMVVTLAGFVQARGHATEAADAAARAAGRCGCTGRLPAAAARTALDAYAPTSSPQVMFDRVRVGSGSAVQVTVSTEVTVFGWSSPLRARGSGVTAVEPR